MGFRAPEDGTSPQRASGHTAVLLAIVVVGAIFRLAAMHNRVLLGDEVGTALGMEQTYWHLMSHFRGWLTQPAYNLLSKLFTQFLWLGEFPIRLPALMFGLGGIVAVYCLGARLFDEKTGIVSALLLALNPYHVFYSQMGRGYTMAATLLTLSLLWMLKITETQKRRYIILHLLSTAGALYCHLGSIGIVPAELILLLYLAWKQRHEQPAKRVLLPVAVSLGAAVILASMLYLPALGDMLAYGRRFTGEDGRGFTLGFIPLMLTLYMGGRGWSIYLYSLFAIVGLSRQAQRRVDGVLLLLAWPAGIFLFYLISDSRVYPWAYTRFFFVALPALALAAACGLAGAADTVSDLFRMSRRGAAMMTGLLITAFLFFTSTKILEISFGERDTHWPTVISRLESTFPPTALILSMPIGSNSFEYYYDRAWSDGGSVTTPRRLISDLRTQQEPVRMRIPIAYVVDIVPFVNEEGFEDFVAIKVGTASILYRRNWREVDSQQQLADLEMITRRIIRFLESRNTEQVTSDLVYWRRGLENQKMLILRGPISSYYSLLASAQQRLGNASGAQYSKEMAAIWAGRMRMPEQVKSSWSMLKPHADFLKFFRGYE